LVEKSDNMKDDLTWKKNTFIFFSWLIPNFFIFYILRLLALFPLTPLLTWKISHTHIDINKSKLEQKDREDEEAEIVKGDSMILH